MPPPTPLPTLARPGWARAAWAAGSLLAAAAAVALAAAHPLAPGGALFALAVWCGVAGWAPRAWLVALPAALPLLNASPFTGWIALEEFDLLLLGTIAAGYARLALRRDAPPAALTPRGRAAVAALAVLTLVSLARGVADAGGWQWSPFHGYTEPLNSLRVAKSTLFALLLLPLVRAAWHGDPADAFRRLALGMLGGAALLTVAVLWERAAYPGLLDIATNYRTTAWFWEMHVGGAAIDAYVVLATPFVAWALWAARGRAAWVAAALFTLLWAYAVLTTYSRGALVGVAVVLLVLGLALPLEARPRWRRAVRVAGALPAAALLLGGVLDAAGLAAATGVLLALAAALWWRWRARAGRRQRALAASLLALALVFEAVLVFGPDSFMNRRTLNSSDDAVGRLTHWRQGLALLDHPADWLVGLGSGRLPAHYDRAVNGGEFPGRVDLMPAGHVRIASARTRMTLAGRHGLTQRVAFDTAYRLAFDVRHDRPAYLLVRVCEQHLLYSSGCQVAGVHLARPSGWRRQTLALRGPPLSPGRPWAPRRHAVLTLSVLNAGASVELDNLVLTGGTDGTAGAGSRALLANGDFSAGLAHWLPSAQSYYVPWHIDNLYLELLIERGVAGLLLALAVVAAALHNLRRAAVAGDGACAFIGAALCGVLALGLVSSVLDVPRVALLASLLVCVGAAGVKSSAPTPQRRAAPARSSPPGCL